LLRRYDIAYFCGVGNSLLSVFPKLAGAKVVLNVDGADFARAKWSGFGRWWLHKSESWAAALAHSVIADNGMIRKRYKELYGADSEWIPYGSNVVTEDPGRAALDKYGLSAKGYFLYVSRLTPENAADLTIEAYLASKQEWPLVVVGDAPYQSDYIERVKSLAAQSKKVIMTGFQFGPAYRQLGFHAGAFILPTAIEATRPVLLDQMGFGNCVIVRDTPGNLEVVGDTGISFAHADPLPTLAAAMNRIAANPQEAQRLGVKARERVAQYYDWEVVTTRYEELFRRLTGKE